MAFSTDAERISYIGFDIFIKLFDNHEARGNRFRAPKILLSNLDFNTLSSSKPPNFIPRSAMTMPITIISELHPPPPLRIFANTYHQTHPFCMTQSLVAMASMRSVTFLQVDCCSNDLFSTYKLILRILQIVILEYCIFYKLTSTHIAHIAYIVLHILRNIVLRCIFYNKLSPSRNSRSSQTYRKCP